MTRAIPMLALAAAGFFAIGAGDSKGFERELAGRIAGPPQSCVPVRQGESLRIVDSQTVAYSSGRILYVNRVGSPCQSWHAGDTLIVEVQGGSYCRGDRVRSLTPGMSIPGPTCILGDFTPYRRPG